MKKEAIVRYNVKTRHAELHNPKIQFAVMLFYNKSKNKKINTIVSLRTRLKMTFK